MQRSDRVFTPILSLCCVVAFKIGEDLTQGAEPHGSMPLPPLRAVIGLSRAAFVPLTGLGNQDRPAAIIQFKDVG